MEKPICKVAMGIKVFAICFLAVGIVLLVLLGILGLVSIISVFIGIIVDIASFLLLYGYAHIIQGVQDLVYLKELEYEEEEEEK